MIRFLKCALIAVGLAGCSVPAANDAPDAGPEMCDGTLPEVHTSNIIIERGDGAWMVLDVRGGTVPSFAIDVTLPSGMWADGGLFLNRTGDELVEVWSNVSAEAGEHKGTLTVSDLCGGSSYDVEFNVKVLE